MTIDENNKRSGSRLLIRIDPLRLSICLLWLYCCCYVSVVECVGPPDYALQQQQQQQREEGEVSSSGLSHQWSSTHPFDRQTKNRKNKLIDISSISLALRTTCEWNRRLQHSSTNNVLAAMKNKNKSVPMWGRKTEGSNVHFHGGHQHNLHGEGNMVNVHPTQTWSPPISRLSWQEQQDQYAASLTIFHAKTPQPLNKRDNRNSNSNKENDNNGGVLRWGPDLEQFLKEVLTSCFQITSPESQSTLLTFAMIYLDRACSVETLRTHHHHYATNQGSPSPTECPYLTPRTVHRLLLTALTLAQRTLYHGTEQAEIRTCIQKTFGIAPAQLHTMEYLMLSALGDYGTDVHHDQYQQFTLLFQQSFQPNENLQQQNEIPSTQSVQIQDYNNMNIQGGLPPPPPNQYHEHHATTDNAQPPSYYEYV